MIKQLTIPGSKVAGFNYHPSYSSCTFETWRCFDAEIFRKELAIGKKFFPGMNSVRLWLSWNAWCRNPQKMTDALKQTLDICEQLDLKTVPVLFNRWHDSMLDCDGIYLDHFLPKSSWLQKYGLPGREFTHDLGKKFKDDPRILAWDLCNEPFAYEQCQWRDEFTQHELNWLRTVNEDLRSENISQPIGIGTWNVYYDELINDLVDCFMTHTYLWIDATTPNPAITPEVRNHFQDKIDELLKLPKATGKPLFTTETCWGSFDDKFRAELVKVTIEMLTANGVGFMAYALFESDFTDIHRPEQGRISPDIGHLEFICRDGTLRPGHDVINQFMR